MFYITIPCMKGFTQMASAVLSSLLLGIYILRNSFCCFQSTMNSINTPTPTIILTICIHLSRWRCEFDTTNKFIFQPNAIIFLIQIALYSKVFVRLHFKWNVQHGIGNSFLACFNRLLQVLNYYVQTG